MTADKPLYVIFTILVLALIGATSVLQNQWRQSSETEIRLDDSARRFNSIHAAATFDKSQGY